MTAEKLIEANSLPAIEHYHTVPVVPESIAIKALKMKEREHQEKIREIREAVKILVADPDHRGQKAQEALYDVLGILDETIND